MGNDYLLEICVDSPESAIFAEEGGAKRVELCANLFEGGTTPSAGCIELSRENIKIDLNVIIRPRGGDFIYSDIEFKCMKRDILISKNLGADGVVLGILKKDGSIDMDRTGELIDLARPMSVTFHRAFDMASNPYKALNDIISLGAQRLLTSGQERTALEGVDLISELVDIAKDKIIIMPGGGINERNILKIINKTHAKELHMSGRVKVDSKMEYRRSNVFMGGELRLPEYEISMVDSNKIERLCNLTKKC